MKYRILSLLYYVTLIFPGASLCYADNPNDFYIQQALAHYFILPQSGRSLSLGGSVDVTCKDVSCIYLNPAGLAYLPKAEAALSIDRNERTGNEFLDEEPIQELSRSGYALFAFRLGKQAANTTDYGTLALGYSRYQGKVNDRITSTPDGYRRSMGYGYGDEDLAAGYSVTFYDDQLHSDLADLHSHAQFLHIFGVQSRLANDWIIGATFHLGIGQSDTEELSTHRSGLSHRRQYIGNLGLVKQLNEVRLSASIDYSHVKSRGDLTDVPQAVVIGSDEEGDFYGVHAGAEMKITNSMPVRLGLRWYEVPHYKFENANLSGLTGGVRGLGSAAGIGYLINGKILPGATLDYGVEYFSAARGSWQHIVTLKVPLDL